MDTIVAPITPASASQRAAVRLSGPDSFRVIEMLSDDRLSFSTYGVQSLRLKIGGLTVPCDCLTMRSPKSYTGDDVVEIHTYGSPALIERLILSILSIPIDGRLPRFASPGEFTKRAVLNDKTDIGRAEAVAALIASTDRAMSRAAYSAMSGRSGERIRSIRDEIQKVLAELEAALDFEALGQISGTVGDIRDRMAALSRELRELNNVIRPLADERKDAIRIVLAGETGTGKSSLYNAILSRLRAKRQSASVSPFDAIVSDEPDTTRDAVCALLPPGAFSDVPVECLLIDTAGGASTMRPTDNDILRLFRSRSYQEIERADIVLHIIDLSAVDKRPEMVDSITNDSLIVGNKADRSSAANGSTYTVDVRVSATTGDGMDDLIERIASRLRALIEGGRDTASGVGVSARIQTDMSNASAALDEAVAAAGDIPDDIAATLLRDAVQQLDKALGESLIFADASEALLDRIFSSFCVGK